MPNSTRSSSASARFRRTDGGPAARLDWRPSRWLLAALALLGILAAASLLASELPPVLAWPSAALVLGWTDRRLRREARRPPHHFVFRSGQPALVDGVAVDDLALQWRGPLVFACWRGSDGRRRDVSWWPDTLPAASRRELRLAAAGGEAARGGTSMAP